MMKVNKKIIIEVRQLDNGTEEKMIRVYRNGKQIKTVLTTRLVINCK